MKKLFTITAFLLGTALLGAQGTDFAPVGARWYYSEVDFALRTVPHIIESVGKEDYQGKWCSKLVSSSNDIVPNPAYVYTENDTVYYFSPSSNQFEMLYNFRAEVGDSWLVGGLLSYDLEGNPVHADTIRVDSMRTLSINGQDLKVWHISNTRWFEWGGRIIEKAGNDGLFMPKFALIQAYVWGIRCFESPDEELHFVPYPCDTVFNFMGSSVTEASTQFKLRAFPNPATDHVFLMPDRDLEEGSGSITLFNQQGVKVGEQVISLRDGQPVRVSLKGLSPGMYAYRVITERGEGGGGKIIVGAPSR